MKILRHFIQVILTVMLTLSCSTKDRYITFSGYAQGGTYTVKMNLNGRKGMIRTNPEVIRDSVDAILQAVDRSLSGYNRNSLLSRFNSGEDIIPDSIFIGIYAKGYDIYRETGGMVDVAAGPLFDLWGFGFRNGEFLTDEKVADTRKGCGMGRLKPELETVIAETGNINGRSLLAIQEGPLPVLNFNAIAQGYSCDLVAGYLRSLGVKDMLVDIGEIYCEGKNPSGQAWSLGIDRPVDGNNEPGAQIQGIFRAPEGAHGIVTSGNYRKFHMKDGKKYAHTIDPRTGYPVTHNLLSATIIAADATTADAYATYCMVAGLEESRKLLEERADLEGCLIYDENGEFQTWCSDGFVMEGL